LAIDQTTAQIDAHLVDSLAAHMVEAGSVDRAAVPLGLLLAWLVNLDLVSADFSQRHGTAVLRLKYRELRGSELLVSACAGELFWNDLNERGKRFLREYYPTYLEVFKATLASDPFDVEDNWDNYEQISRVLTKALLDPNGSGGSRKSGRAWWAFWQR